MFAAYVLYANQIWMEQTLQLLLSGVLPMLLCGLLYGGLSVYLSLKKESGRSTLLATVLALVSLLLFSFFAVFNFLPHS